MTDDYIKIDWPDVKAGDVLMRENGDRLTVERGGEVIVEAVGHELATDAWAHMGFSPYRRKPELPTEPGAYADKRGMHWLLNTDGGWCESGFGWQAAEEAAEFAPFTRLVPMPTEAQVAGSVDRLFDSFDDAAGPHAMRSMTIAAVMALLRGDANSTEVE